MRFDLRMLGREDADAFRALRLEALERHPCAFAATHEEESGQSAAEVADRLVRETVFGGLVDGALEGVAGFATPGPAKKMHKGVLWGVYVSARRRGQGLGRALVGRVIEHARGRVAQLHAAVVTCNAAACGLYRDLGFVTYGIEPRALKIGETYVDQELMVLMLGEASRSDPHRSASSEEHERAAARAIGEPAVAADVIPLMAPMRPAVDSAPRRPRPR